MGIYIIYSLIFIGIFLPSSINGNYIGVFYNIFSFILAMIVLILSIKRIDKIRTILVLTLLLFLMVNTYFTNFNNYQIGTLLVIIPVLFFFSIDLKEININILMNFLNIISLVLFVLGLGVIFNITIFDDFLGHYYVGTFTDLYKYMLNANRPVGPFGTHSISAFIYYVLFLFYYIAWLYFKQLRYFIYAIIYVILILTLKSFSALLFILFALFTIINSNFLLNRVNFNFFLFNISILVMLFIISDSYIDIFTLLAGTENNGLLSRYGDHGVLQYNIQYLKNNLFMGDGLGYFKNLLYTDSGYIHALLTYGISGTIIFYITFSMIILKKNYSYLLILLSACLFFDIGYDIFFYIRYFFILILMSFFISGITVFDKDVKR